MNGSKPPGQPNACDLDASPVTVTLPDPGGRFMSMIAIDEEQYALQTVYAPGTLTYTRDWVGTRYLMIGLRTFVDPNDPKDVACSVPVQRWHDRHRTGSKK